jgi:Ca-activated chloride channel family protein
VGARLPHRRHRAVSFLAPLLAVFGVSVPAILVLYILKVRRRDVVVPSTLLWRGDAVDRQASVPWQRIRPSWLLFLQLLTAIALVLALTRPALAHPAALGPDTVVIVDASGPMQATDVSPSRFAVAVVEARTLADQLSSGQRMTLIAMDANPRVIAASGGDHGVLDAALDALRPEAGLADLRAALALATAAPGGSGDRRVIVISDGVVDISGPTVTLPFPVEYRRVGANGENLGISGITVSGVDGARILAINVTNYGTARHATTVETRADGHLVDARAIDVEPGGSVEVDVALSGSPHTVTADLTPHDAFALDDTASAVVQPPRVIQAVLVTQRNVFLQEALQLRSDIHLVVETPAAYRPRSDVDLWIFDGFVPPVLPAQPYWLVGPPATREIGAGAEVRPGPLIPASAGDPLMAGVDVGNVAVAQSRDLSTSSFGRAIIDSQAGPVLLVRDAAPRAALLGFDLHDSDLPLSPAFPVLVERLSEYLAPDAVPPGPVEPDTPVDIPVLGGGSVTVTRPDGSTETLTVAAQTGDAVVTDTDHTGLYNATIRAAGAQRAVTAHFAVDALDPARSAITPQSTLTSVHGAAGSPNPSGQGTVFDDLWPWLAVLALAVLTVEWAVFHRGR